MEASTVRHLVLPLVVYGALVSLCGLLWSQPMLLLCLLGLLAGICLPLFGARRATVAFLVGCIFGPAGECLSIAGGAWSYAGTDHLFPVWLPFAWGVAAVCLLVFVQEIVGRMEKSDHGS